MTTWTVLVEVEADRDTVTRLREMLQDLLESTTGSRPRTKTVESWMLNAALKRAHPAAVEPRREADAGTPLWEGPVLR